MAARRASPLRFQERVGVHNYPYCCISLKKCLFFNMPPICNLVDYRTSFLLYVATHNNSRDASQESLHALNRHYAVFWM